MGTRISPTNIVIEFGESEWQAWLGGGFWGPERNGPISWNWLSNRPAWCVLPPLDVAHDYRLTLEAAPLAFYERTLWDFQLWAGERRLMRRVVPTEAEGTRIELVTGQIMHELGRLPERLEWRIQKLERPTIALSINDLPLATFVFACVPHVQRQECVLRHELLRERNVMHFAPNYSVAHTDVDPASSDDRQLSFRFYRLRIEQLRDPKGELL